MAPSCIRTEPVYEIRFAVRFHGPETKEPIAMGFGARHLPKKGDTVQAPACRQL